MSIMKRRSLNQEGIGSLLFTMIMILVISLIVLGFSQLARRNQRQTLDNQLSTQAYYAAESGVNSALHILRSPHFNESTGDDKNCNQFINNNGGGSQLNPTQATAATYTCVLVDQGAMDSLVYQTVSPTNGIIVPINPVGNLTGLTFSWTKPAGAVSPVSNCSSNNNLPPAASYNCPYGMLRIDIVPIAAGASHSIASLQTSNRTFFIKPVDNGSLAFNLSDNQPLQKAKCTASNCQVQITGMSGSYALHISSVYAAVPSLEIAPLNLGVKLAGAQVLIDATGRSQDVLRRIRVRAPIDQQQVSVTGAIVSNQSICKRFTVGDGVGFNAANAGVTCP